MPNLLRGTVTKVGAMRKTITVTIERKFEHPKLLKPITRTKKMLVHDEDEHDRVTIIHGKPVSSAKHFRLSSIDKRAADSARAAPAQRAGHGKTERAERGEHGERGSEVLRELSRRVEEPVKGETVDGA